MTVVEQNAKVILSVWVTFHYYICCCLYVTLYLCHIKTNDFFRLNLRSQSYYSYLYKKIVKGACCDMSIVFYQNLMYHNIQLMAVCNSITVYILFRLLSFMDFLFYFYVRHTFCNCLPRLCFLHSIHKVKTQTHVFL